MTYWLAALCGAIVAGAIGWVVYSRRVHPGKVDDVVGSAVQKAKDALNRK